MIILGIETSCDDTGVALIECDQQNGCRILSNIVSSQIKIHAPFGGVVPNLAARAHLKNIEPVLKTALKEAQNPKIDLLAVTRGPGLIPSLLIGVNFAKALAYVLKKPIIGINHIEGHIYANWLTKDGKVKSRPFKQSPQATDSQWQPLAFWQPLFPALCLVVSGGHTQLVLMKDHGQYKLLGETRDDAAGEAFDKVAKLLNLGYPGGPIISRRAQKGNPQFFNLPRPMLKTNDFDFSFSGLKTAVLYKIKEVSIEGSPSRPCPRQNRESDPKGQPFTKTNFINNMSASFQQAVIDVLVGKTIQAAQKYRVKTVLLSGGVTANQELRRQMTEAIKRELPTSRFHIPKPEFCTDNGAMIAAAAFYQKKPTSKQSWSKIETEANLKLIA